MSDLERRIIALERLVDRLTLDTRGRYYPVTPTNLTDSAATTWSAATPAAGTYTFRPEDNGMLWPSGAQAVVVLLIGAWGTASIANYILGRQTPTGTFQAYIVAIAANIHTSGSFPIETEPGTGYFYLVVGGTATYATARILGYIA